jgi:hypothetical protein
MEKKTILYVVGGVAVLGIAYYLMNRKKSPIATDTDNTISEEDVKPVPRPTPSPTEPLPPREKPPVQKSEVKKLTAEQLEMELQKGCGKKPKLKKNIALYNQCRANLTAKLKGKGLVAFDGTYESVVSNDFFSSFNNNFDLNL